MAKCKNCNNLYNLSNENDEIVGKWCPKKNESPDIEMERECKYYDVMKNADRIRSMTDEELGEFITNQFCHGIGKELITEWLQRPVEV